MADPTRLALLILKRDAIEDAIDAGQSVVELEIRGRRVRVEANLAKLDYLNGQIEAERRRQSGGIARNQVRGRR